MLHVSGCAPRAYEQGLAFAKVSIHNNDWIEYKKGLDICHGDVYFTDRASAD